MDRQITYPGQLLAETSLLQATKDSMIGFAKLSSALLGTSTVASGFAVTPTGPASLQVLCAPGEIYSLTAVDALAFSTLPADTTHSIFKQGILLDGVTLSCPAPGTTGQSINYLVQVTYQDTDATPVLLPYYNSANPSLPFSGMGNNGLPQNTVRKGSAIVAVKAGASATTGTQVTPAPDAGYIGLYSVTVAFGQTTITAGNIILLATAPLINSTLHGLAPVFTSNPVVPNATLSGHALPLGQTQTMFSPIVGHSRNAKISVPSASATATFTADEVVVETALGGQTYRLSGLSKNINLATTGVTAGVGGMDTGAAPVSGFVAIYLIYNPATGASAIIAKNATSAAQTETYTGGSMPSGYTASALISVWGTDGSGLLKVGSQVDRFVWLAGIQVLSTTTANGTLTALNISAAVPPNAVSVKVRTSIAAANSGVTMTTSVAGSTTQIGISTSSGTSPAAGAGLTAEAGVIPIITSQNIFYTDAVASGLVASYTINISGYGF